MRSFEEEWRSRFERFAQRHDADHLVSGWSDHGLRRRLSLFDELIRSRGLKPPTLTLDLGCGAGTYVRYLAALGHTVIGLDYSLPSLDRALVADPQRAGHYAGGEAYALPFKNACFDLVVSIGVLQALGHPERALDEMVRVLRPQGLLVVEALNAFEPVAVVKSACERLSDRPPRVRAYSPFRVRRWLTRRGLRTLGRAGVYLPPRRLPWLGKVIDQRRFVRLMEGIPGLALAGAHAFLLVGKKDGAVAGVKA